MKIVWNKVTKYSQLIAIILFVAVFALGYLLGKDAGYYKGMYEALQNVAEDQAGLHSEQ